MRIFKRSVLILMALMTLAPILCGLAGKGNIYAITENRNRRSFPKMSDIRENGFIVIDEWFNDNFGLRDVLIRFQHQVDYSLFHHSKELFFSRVDDREYLHYRSVVSSGQINNEVLFDEKKDRIVSVFMSIKECLESKKVSFKFIIPPQKNEVLPGVSKQFPVKRPDETAYVKMENTFNDSELRDNYVSIINELKEKNVEHPVFYQTDFHWNDWGAAVAFGKVINEFASEIGLENVYKTDLFEFSTFTPGYNDNQLSSLSVLKYHIPNEITCNYVRDEYAAIVSDIKYQNLVVWENNKDFIMDGAVVFVGDSYTPPALYAFSDTHSGLTELFHRTYFCHWDNAEGLLKDLPDDTVLVIVEAIEDGLWTLDMKAEVLLN